MDSLKAVGWEYDGFSDAVLGTPEATILFLNKNESTVSHSLVVRVAGKCARIEKDF